MKIKLSAFVDWVRQSLFVVPTGFVLGGVVLGQLAIELDGSMRGQGGTHLPFILTSTVASARAVLSTIAGATITVAGIAFSVSVLTVQLAASQYSPRVVDWLFRDPFNKRVTGLVAGTFSYCLIVLRAVRSPIDGQGQPVIPNISVALGVLLGIVAIMAIIAFINHSAHSIEVGTILHSVAGDARRSAGAWGSPEGMERARTSAADPPDGDGFSIRFTREGWVQVLDHSALMEVLPEGGTIRLDTSAGRFVLPGSPACTVWPSPADEGEVADRVRAAIRVGPARTLRQDAAYGIRQLADVALRALSPGINDPTTAGDAIVHLTSVLRVILERDPPPRGLITGTRRLLIPDPVGHEELIDLAFDEIRLAGATQPTVCVYLIESMGALARSLPAGAASATATLALRDRARLVEGNCETAGWSDHDRELVRDAFARSFDRALT